MGLVVGTLFLGGWLSTPVVAAGAGHSTYAAQSKRVAFRPLQRRAAPSGSVSTRWRPQGSGLTNFGRQPDTVRRPVVSSSVFHDRHVAPPQRSADAASGESIFDPDFKQHRVFRPDRAAVARGGVAAGHQGAALHRPFRPMASSRERRYEAMQTYSMPSPHAAGPEFGHVAPPPSLPAYPAMPWNGW
jgi:hypothetical protein